ncbi:PolC-type DNA polymerase III [Clostridium sp.]|uniref:PolC-type DNA polymerase III n=1 Tax=Clostridium sp. TaxID=1506 RepID=UPI003464560E
MSVDIFTPIIKNNDSLKEELKLSRIQYFKNNDTLRVVFKCKRDIEESVDSMIRESIISNIGEFTNLDIVYFKELEDVTLEEVAMKYWFELTNIVIEKIPVSKELLHKCERVIEGDILILKHSNEFMCKMLKSKNLHDILKSNIKDMFGIVCNISIVYDLNVGLNNNYTEEKIKENNNLVKKIMENRVSSPKAKSENNSRKPKEQGNKYGNGNKYQGKEKADSKVKDENVLYGNRQITDEISDINTLTDSSGIVTICGDIFKTDVIETKNGTVIFSFFITDYTSSITVKFFPKKDVEELINNIKSGIRVKVKGECSYDMYSREITLKARNIVKVEQIERMDISEEKRVELHTHTTMSTMDAVSSPGKIIERAAKWGHKAIAITDHGVVQAYPEAMDTGKKHGIKVIYGVEGYLVNNGVPIVLKERGQNLDDTYVVFDIETTGFSNQNDKIIEIGAVKIENGKITDRFSRLVNPERPIPAKIVELTSITESMVEKEDTIDIVLKNFIEFIGDSVVVAHNAAFDTSFIRKNAKDLELSFDNSVMDTIPLAKFLYPELKRFKLNVIAKYLGISLENHHRAVDDAEATAEILLHSFNILKNDKNIETLKVLNDEFLSNIDIKKLPMYHIIILAKNQVGLKNLYKLISSAHLDNFFKKPRLPKTLIEEYREGLIIGSACESGELFRGLLENLEEEDIEEILTFYDYLEIQPIDNNAFLIRDEKVKDRKELENLNRRIYNLGKKYSKPVVATCDVHFLDPKDEVFRRIILAGQGFRDADNSPPLYFRTTNEMLKEFSYLGEDKAKEVVIENTNKVAEMIGDVKPIPDETFPPKIDGAEEDIRNMTMDKAHSIYGNPLPEVVQKRVDKELNSIINNGYAVLYLIAHKLVAKSLQDGYLVGSRGSVGSSLVATMTDITEVNGLPPHYVCPKCKNSEFILDGSISSGADLPYKKCPECDTEFIREGHDIPFETFLGFEGDKEPDIDLNFSGEYQSVVHKYTEVLFGKGYVFKAGTIGTVAEKTAYGYVKKYLDEREIIVPQAEIERLTMGCTGIKRTTGQHPGGIMVVPRDNEIFNFCPIQHPADDNDTDIITTHFDYHSISGRLLKLDILGHDDPTMIRMLQDLTGIDPKTIPLNDEEVLSLFTKPDALGVTKEELECEVGTYGLPEFGTKFVRQMLLDTEPKTFSDLVRISGLSHGTDVWLNNAQYFIKEGYTTLKDCISTRDDIMVYLIYKGVPPKTAFTIMEKVRKGKGLKDEDVKVMKENKVPDWYIESCNRIKYMFPKGHAVAYVMMAVRIAYFKVHYPEAYYATYFTVRADDFDADLIVKGEGVIKDKIQEINNLGNNMTQKDKGLLTVLEICYEMYKREIKFLKVDLYKSDAVKFLIEEGGIRPPINSLQGVGDNAAKSIVESRGEGEFISKEDLRLRAKVSKTVIETLGNHGCLEGLSETNQLSLF